MPFMFLLLSLLLLWFLKNGNDNCCDDEEEGVGDLVPDDACAALPKSEDIHNFVLGDNGDKGTNAEKGDDNPDVEGEDNGDGGL